MQSHDIVHAHDCKCIAWKPIIVGALVAVGMTFLLNVFGVAIGLTAFTTNSEGVENLAFGGLLGTCIGIIASMFGAGWLAGYLGQRYCAKRHLGSLYGFLAWSVALIVLVFLSHPLHQYVSYYTYMLAGTPDVVMEGGAATTTATAHTVTISAYIVFVLFFLSALSAGLGGHCGMSHSCNKSKACIR